MLGFPGTKDEEHEEAKPSTVSWPFFGLETEGLSFGSSLPQFRGSRPMGCENAWSQQVGWNVLGGKAGKSFK